MNALYTRSYFPFTLSFSKSYRMNMHCFHDWKKKINAVKINNGKHIEGEYPRLWSVQEGQEFALRKSRCGDDSGDGTEGTEGSMCGAEHSRAKTIGPEYREGTTDLKGPQKTHSPLCSLTLVCCGCLIFWKEGSENGKSEGWEWERKRDRKEQ